MKLRNIASIGLFLIFGSALLFFQNFVLPTKSATIEKIAAADPKLAEALIKMDDSYLKYSQRIADRKARGRLAELEYEHRKMKSDLIRATSFLNPSLLDTSAEAGNYAADSATLFAIMNQLWSRRNLYVVSVQNATANSLPTKVKIVWTGGAASRPKFDLVLASNQNHSWEILEDEGTSLDKVESYVITDKVNIALSTVVRSSRPWWKGGSNKRFSIQPNTTTKAHYLMDALIAENGSDYRLKSNHAVGAGGTLVINVAAEPEVTSPVRGALVAKLYGGPIDPLSINFGMSAGSIFPTSITAEDAFQYIDYYYRNNYPNREFIEFYWRGLLIKRSELDSPLPPSQPSNPLGNLEIYLSDTKDLQMKLLNVTEIEAGAACKLRVQKYTTIDYTCFWNGKIIFEQVRNKYRTIYATVFAPKCLACHDANKAVAGLDLSNYEALIAKGKVIPYRPEVSLLYTRLSDSTPHANIGISDMMGYKKDILRWIQSGALK